MISTDALELTLPTSRRGSARASRCAPEELESLSAAGVDKNPSMMLWRVGIAVAALNRTALHDLVASAAGRGWLCLAQT